MQTEVLSVEKQTLVQVLLFPRGEGWGEGYCSCLVCLYPSVHALAASASVETSKQRYSRVSLRLFLD